MAANLTISDLLDRVIRRERASGAKNVDRTYVLEDMQDAYNDIISYGDMVAETGWSWNVWKSEITITSAMVTDGAPLELEIDSPGVHRILSIRLGSNTSQPITLDFLGQLEADDLIVNRDDTGTPERFWLYDVDPATGYHSIWVHPFWASAPSDDIIVRYVGSPPGLTDSGVAADNIYVPDLLRDVLVWGTLIRRYHDDDRARKRMSATMEYKRCLSQLVAHHHAQKRKPDLVIAESEKRVWARQQDPRYSLDRYGRG